MTLFTWSLLWLVHTADKTVLSRSSFDESALAVWTQLEMWQNSFVSSPIVFTPLTRQFCLDPVSMSLRWQCEHSWRCDKTVLSRLQLCLHQWSQFVGKTHFHNDSLCVKWDVELTYCICWQIYVLSLFLWCDYQVFLSAIPQRWLSVTFEPSEVTLS